MSNLLLFLLATASAAAMDKDAFKATQDSIGEAYRSDQAQCASLKGNARDVCEAEAKAKRKIEKAEAEAEYKNTAKARTMAIVARADAEYSVARKQCDVMSGTEKTVCVTKAKAARVRAKADARANQEVIRKRNADSEIALERQRLDAK